MYYFSLRKSLCITTEVFNWKIQDYVFHRANPYVLLPKSSSGKSKDMFSTGKIQGYVFRWENLRLCFPLRKFKVMFSTANILMYYYRSLQLGMSKFMFSVGKSLRITTEVFNWEKSKVMFSTEKMFIYYCRSLQLENPRLFFPLEKSLCITIEVPLCITTQLFMFAWSRT
jgi:hypothetical protein